MAEVKNNLLLDQQPHSDQVAIFLWQQKLLDILGRRGESVALLEGDRFVISHSATAVGHDNGLLHCKRRTFEGAYLGIEHAPRCS